MKKVRRLFAITFLSLLSVQNFYAGIATWSLNPGSGDWNTAANWTPAVVPNSPTSMATFALSNTTSISLSANTEVDGSFFNQGASAFTITASPRLSLTMSGHGILNDSGITQNFVSAVDATGQSGMINFTNNANAGSFTNFTNNGGGVGGANGGFVFFTTAVMRAVPCSPTMEEQSTAQTVAYAFSTEMHQPQMVGLRPTAAPSAEQTAAIQYFSLKLEPAMAHSAPTVAQLAARSVAPAILRLPRMPAQGPLLIMARS